MAEKREAAPPPMPRGQGFALIGMLFILLLTVDAQARAALGLGMSFLLTPVIGFGGHLVVMSMLFAGLLTGLVSVGLRHWSSDYVAMERARLLQRSFQIQLNDARLKGDVDRINRLRRAQPHILQRTMEHQPGLKGPTVLTTFFAIAMFWWLSVFLDPAFGLVRVESVSLPWASSWPLHAIFPFLLPLPYWVALYSIMSLPFTLAFQAALKLWRYRKLDLEAPLPPVPTLDDILKRVEAGEEDEATIDREVERARKRVKARPAGAVEETPEDSVDIVHAPDAEIETAEDEDVRIVEPTTKTAALAEPDAPAEQSAREEE